MSREDYSTHNNVVDDGPLHSARITCDQLGALALWLEYGKVLSDTKVFCQSKKPQPMKQTDLALVRRWLTNAWSTEYFLTNISADLGDEAIAYAVHWAYPQAYYAVFALRMALATAVGNNEDTHQKVIRRFGDDARNGRLPDSLSICVTGIKKDWKHYKIPEVPFDTDTRLRRFDKNSVIGYVGSLLRGTREYDLSRLRQERKKEFKTKQGRLRKSLSKDNWHQIADKLGPTNIMSFLYRKRIKANYDDVDAFHNDVVEAPQLLADIKSVVRAFAIVHETLICQRIGRDSYEELLSRVPSRISAFSNARSSDVYSCLSAKNDMMS